MYMLIPGLWLKQLFGREMEDSEEALRGTRQNVDGKVMSPKN